MEKCANMKINIVGREVCGATEYVECSEKRPFYITVAGANASREQSNARLRGLADSEQLGISEKYYDGKMPWKK